MRELARWRWRRGPGVDGVAWWNQQHRRGRFPPGRAGFFQIGIRCGAQAIEVDLARACLAALWRGKPQRVYNVSDASAMKMGDYFDLAADLYGLPRPPRVPRSTAQDALPVMLLSFMSESRRLDNRRLLGELGLRLRYPTVAQGLRA